MSVEEYENQTSVETNACYMMALALDLMVRDNDRRMKQIGTMLNERSAMRQKTKMLFNEYTKAVKRACLLNEQITQDIYDVDEKHDFRNVQLWQEQANELARTVLLFADKSTDLDASERIQAYMRSIPGEGIVTEDMLKPFYLKKL